MMERKWESSVDDVLEKHRWWLIDLNEASGCDEKDKGVPEEVMLATNKQTKQTK